MEDLVCSIIYRIQISTHNLYAISVYYSRGSCGLLSEHMLTTEIIVVMVMRREEKREVR